jgi:predicted TIM-barrel fold metal-dependent hydrolase
VHQHVVPPRYAEWFRAKGLRPGGIDLPDWSRSAALKFMDGRDIATGILSVSTPGVHLGDDAEAASWARAVNEYCAELVRAEPERFGFFATLTLPDVDAAVVEAEYALDTLRADGIVLLANNGGRYLGDPGFAPLLDFLHRRRAVVFIHPGELPAEPVPGIPSFTADFLLDTTRTAISLILSGALKRYDGIRFILAHAGGFVPYIAYRILLTQLSVAKKTTQVLAALDQKHQVPKLLEPLRRFYYDVALSSTPAALPSLFETADPAHVLYGSDFPFAPSVAVGFMAKQYERTPIDPAIRAGIDRANAERLFPRLA